MLESYSTTQLLHNTVALVDDRLENLPVELAVLIIRRFPGLRCHLLTDLVRFRRLHGPDLGEEIGQVHFYRARAWRKEIYGGLFFVASASMAIILGCVDSGCKAEPAMLCASRVEAPHCVDHVFAAVIGCPAKRVDIELIRVSLDALMIERRRRRSLGRNLFGKLCSFNKLRSRHR